MKEFAIDRMDDTVQVHLKLHGDLDLYNAPAFDDALVAVVGHERQANPGHRNGGRAVLAQQRRQGASVAIARQDRGQDVRR